MIDDNFRKSSALEERTLSFASEIIVLCKSIPETTVTKPILSQLTRSGTSIGANYCEAINASSRKDFKNKIFICKKEAQETKYWLHLLSKAEPTKKENITKLWNECHEFNLIFQKIVTTMSNDK